MVPSLARDVLQRSGEHLLLVALSIGLALLIALPLGLAIHARPQVRRCVLAIANSVQTIPSLAIFGLLLTVPVLGGIGPTPAVVALTLYALLPLLRGLVSGLQQVPPGVMEAAQALGLSPGQVMRQIALPLARPSLMNGVRVATVITVGLATIAAAIGAGGLGVFIFRGIATVDNGLLLAGALPAAAIALAADAVLASLERQEWQSPAGRQQRPRRPRRTRALSMALASAALLGTTLFTHPWLERAPSGTVVIGSKGFTEQLLLAELLAQEIEAATPLKVKRAFNLGSTFLCHHAVREGRIDGYVEYTGTAWSAILKQPSPRGNSNRERLWRETSRLYRERFNLQLFPSLGFENSFALLIRKRDGEQLGLRTISEAVAPARRWRAAFGYEFLNRADGYPKLQQRYGLIFAEPPIAMDLGLTYRALADGRVDLIAGDSTNGLIPALGLQALVDDRSSFPPYDAVPVFNRTSLQRHPELVAVIDNLAGRISASTMQQLNAQVDLQKRSPQEVVQQWRVEHDPKSTTTAPG